MGLGLACGLAEVLGRLGLRPWGALLEGWERLAGELRRLSWRAGSAGLRTKAALDEGRSGTGFLAGHHWAGGPGGAVMGSVGGFCCEDRGGVLWLEY